MIAKVLPQLGKGIELSYAALHIRLHGTKRQEEQREGRT
jgi:hypothetical protein